MAPQDGRPSAKHLALAQARRAAAALVRFCKTPSPLRTVLLVVLAIQPLLLFLASRMHMDFWNYVVLNLVFVGFWRLAAFVYKKAFNLPPEE